MSLEIVFRKGFRSDWKLCFPTRIGIIILTGDFYLKNRLFFKMATIFLKKRKKNSTDGEVLNHRKVLRKELFEGDKVFSHKIICIFRSILIVRAFFRFFKIMFCPTSWIILEQLDSLISLFNL